MAVNAWESLMIAVKIEFAGILDPSRGNVIDKFGDNASTSNPYVALEVPLLLSVATISRT